MSQGHSLGNTEAGGKGRRENGELKQGDRQQIGKAGILGAGRGSLIIALSHPPPPSSSPVLTTDFLISVPRAES